MFNRKFSSNMRRKKRMIILTIILLVVFLSTGYAVFTTNLGISGALNVSKYDQTLYGVLEKAAKKGIYAREYTGAHQDSMAGTGTKKIYHWYAPTGTSGDTLANEILDKNNVIFADHCWQMIRTTDTGGVKMIYNGEPENGQCLNTRGNHVGYSSRTTQSMSPTYYYGTSYTYDKINNVFRLDGTVTTGTIKTGQYTCRSTNSNDTCSTLYLVDELIENSDYYNFGINGNAHYSQYGKTFFNTNKSPAYTGYMYNSVYSMYSTYSDFYVAETSKSPIYPTYYYSNNISYDSNQYSLPNAQLISSLSDYNELVNKYILSTGSNTSSDEARYVVAVDGDYYYYKKLVNGDLTTSLMVGSTYTDNNNGTYTLNNPISVSYINWYNGEYANHRNKYACIGSNATCSDLKHIANTSAVVKKNQFRYCTPLNNYKFSEDVNYNAGMYTLAGDVVEIWDFYISTEANKINTHHYTCLEEGTTCSMIKYTTNVSENNDYVVLSGVSNITTALNNMLNADDVNQTNSIIKKAVDSWYKRYMNSYTTQLEDVIFCNDRTVRNIGAWSPTSYGIDSNNLQFTNSYGNLSCTNITDMFSKSNIKAQLTYPVGLANTPEFILLNNNIIRTTGQRYWLETPSHQITNTVVSNITATGGVSSEFLYSSSGLRPVVSLKPGTEYTSGTGSMADPYIVDTYVFSINANYINIGDSVANLGTIYGSPEEADTNFNKYTFLRHEIKNGVVESSSIAFKKNGKYYYVKSGGASYNNSTNQYNEDSIYYESNKEILSTAFGSSNCTETVNPLSYICNSSEYNVLAFANGYVDGGRDWLCRIQSYGASDCFYQ